MSARDRLPDRPESLWIATTPRTAYPRLDEDIEVDVAILGAGIVGVTSAALLKAAGLTVALLEARRVAEGVTGYTTAKLTSLHRLVYADLVARHGAENARLYAEANEAAIQKVASLRSERGIDCDFEWADAFTYAEDARGAEAIREEVRVARELGLPADLVTATELPFPVAAAVRLPRQARFHPRKYLLALAASIPGDGSAVYEETMATAVSDSRAPEVATARGRVRAQMVIVATHQPFPLRGLYFARMWSKRSFVVAARLDGPVPRGLYISAEDDFHSLRPHEEGDDAFLLVGGESHPTGQGGDTRERLRRLERWARERFPVRSVECWWATQDNVTPDGVPFAGRLSSATKTLLVATGFGGWGMSNGVAAAMLLTDLVLGRPNPWQGLYDPARRRVRSSLAGLAHDAVGGVRNLLGRHDPDSGGRSASEVPVGEGRVLTRGIEKVAVHRDEDGALHAVSAVCTHLQCIVRWNAAERSWDCPCHGSRFDPRGRVIHGPALTDLPPVDLEEE
jgi:glycine/D-amino acid oxidase-like deaminating enzyme/nitrite reductase/ring-hydroxylating ferredoxin subunit